MNCAAWSCVGNTAVFVNFQLEFAWEPSRSIAPSVKGNKHVKLGN